MADPADAPAPLISMRQIHKRFSGVHALRGVNFEIGAGEVVALLGENGAGKSTLIKILGGAHEPSSGQIILDGNEIHFHHPLQARDAGIAVIYQELNLIPGLTIRENIFLGQESKKAPFLDHGGERSRARACLERVGMPLDPDLLCSSLTVAQQQAVEIAKALAREARLVVMDEPSAALSPREVEQLFNIVRDLRRQGIGVIYISHRLEEIYEVCDRVVILRDGEQVGEGRVGDLTRDRLIELMVGRPLESEFPRRKSKIGEVTIEVSGLCRGSKVREVSFRARAGEVLGFAGLVGSGRSETMRVLFGADRKEKGTIRLGEEDVEISDPRDAIRNGICFLSEDRKGEGLVLKHSVIENFALPNLDHFSRNGILDRNLERKEFDRYTRELRIKIPSPDQLARNLSGGNQQKVVLAKWLAHRSEIIIVDEPTRGIDVGAKFEIYQLINRLAEAGKTIILVSSELEEVLGMSDRIIVMHEGEVRGELDDVSSATAEDILTMAIGTNE